MTAKKVYQKEIWFMVSLALFASPEAREEYLQKGSAELHSRTIFYGRTEQWAAVRFYRACLQVHKDPLIQGVTMTRDGDLVAWVGSGVPRAWSMPSLAF